MSLPPYLVTGDFDIQVNISNRYIIIRKINSGVHRRPYSSKIKISLKLLF